MANDNNPFFELLIEILDNYQIDDEQPFTIKSIVGFLGRAIFDPREVRVVGISIAVVSGFKQFDALFHVSPTPAHEIADANGFGQDPAAHIAVHSCLRAIKTTGERVG